MSGLGSGVWGLAFGIVRFLKDTKKKVAIKGYYKGCLGLLGFQTYLKSQVARNNRLPYPKVAHNWLK